MIGILDNNIICVFQKKFLLEKDFFQIVCTLKKVIHV